MIHPTAASSVIAFDVGEARIGVAAAGVPALLPRPLTTLANDREIMHDIVALAQRERALCVVIGLPRGLQGQATAQTRAVEAFGHDLEQHLGIPLYWQDEAVTSKQAEQELEARGKPYKKGDIDALAATYILEDFIRDHKDKIV
ncbi:MAG: Holliday junction resolvase RuvX [Candidatus Saccharimonadales bacterium]